MQRPQPLGRGVREVARQRCRRARAAAGARMPLSCSSRARPASRVAKRRAVARPPQGISRTPPANAASSSTCRGSGRTSQRPNRESAANTPSTASAGHSAGQSRSTVTTSRASQHPEPEACASAAGRRCSSPLSSSLSPCARASPGCARPRTAARAPGCGLITAKRSPVDQHLGRTGPRIVVRRHHRPIGTGTGDRDQVARRQHGQHAVPAQHVAALADRPHHIHRQHRLRPPPARAPAAPGGARHTSPAGSGCACPNRGRGSAGRPLPSDRSPRPR